MDTRRADMKTMKLPTLWELIRRGEAEYATWLYPRVAYRFRGLIPVVKLMRRFAFGRSAWPELSEYVVYLMKSCFRKEQPMSQVPYQSLRLTVKVEGPLPSDSFVTLPLRSGR